MMLVEETQVLEAALPVEALKDHLLLGSGFTEGDLQDPVLVSFLRAAIAAIEGRTSKALITRGFLVTLDNWTAPDAQRLPVAPVQAITEVALVDAIGVATIVDPVVYRLQKDAFDPRLRPIATSLPSVPTSGTVEIRFEAGYGAAFDAVPEDLKQAALMLAAHYYEYRSDMALSQGCMPFGVTSLIARYRPVRMGMGA
ncbi:phage gp6-like head-tail connector protein [Antarctobacter heliothermus]|uniref:Phage gp6-like head-tail connector protein n=1 Tax=Antarctobacter heliothermus TaxID=74033 RepID=A0A222E668_9RHOB|nr:head-tail connector protein [Antarctobacter heliothermus]ASP21676.1 phage gp6-like head-tail connector protein [Antarctobacter heliothermus]